MLKVFLVEDEIVVRESIRENFPWERHGFQLVGEAGDGEMALPMIEELSPDIVITDIKMPFMDGLELSRILKKKMPWLKLVILSGHDEFTYAREALSIGVDDYVLKPIVPEDLERILGNMQKLIIEDKRKRDSLEEMKQLVSRHSDFMKERFLGDLAFGFYSSSAAVEKAEFFGLEITSRYYCVLLLGILFPEAKPSVQGSMQVESILNELLLNNPDLYKFRINAMETGLVLRGNETEAMTEQSYEIARSVKAVVEKSTECELQIAIGGVRERISGIAQSMNDARVAAGFDYIFGSRAIVGKEDADKIGPGQNRLPDSAKEGILHFLKTGHASESGEAARKTVERIGGKGRNVMFSAFALTDILSTVSDFVREMGGEPEEVLPDLARFKELFADGNGVDDNVENAHETVCAFLTRVLESALGFRDGKRESRYGDLIARAKAYIEKHYGNRDLALADVAGHAGMSAGHFSTVFSQETEQTFIEYLTEVRINKSLELLKTSSRKIADIAFDVGYSDSHYFFHIFKKKMGQTPGSYRAGV